MNWYSYSQGRLADIVLPLGEGLLFGRSHLYGTFRYILSLHTTYNIQKTQFKIIFNMAHASHGWPKHFGF